MSNSLISLEGKKITLVLYGQDLRAGFSTLSQISSIYLGIDVHKGEDCVVFVSKNRLLCKIIFSDSKGSTLITRKLHEGKFEQFMAEVNSKPQKKLTPQELIKFLNGQRLMCLPKSIYKS